jgi:hypothetical protein
MSLVNPRHVLSIASSDLVVPTTLAPLTLFLYLHRCVCKSDRAAPVPNVRGLQGLAQVPNASSHWLHSSEAPFHSQVTCPVCPSSKPWLILHSPGPASSNTPIFLALPLPIQQCSFCSCASSGKHPAWAPLPYCRPWEALTLDQVPGGELPRTDL